MQYSQSKVEFSYKRTNGLLEVDMHGNVNNSTSPSSQLSMENRNKSSPTQMKMKNDDLDSLSSYREQNDDD
jgi:hypothetical protein